MPTENNTQKDDIGQWVNNKLMPFFAKYETKMIDNGSEKIFIDIWDCFAKNSCAIFELLPMKSASYQVAQAMRFLVELTADANFIVNHAENVVHLKKRTSKLVERCEREKDVTKWRKYIADARNINLLVGHELANKAGYDTKKRVEDVFGKKFYNFYSSYAHVNMFVIWDDLHRLVDDSYVGTQRWELIRDFPLIMEKFIHIIGKAVMDTDLEKKDCTFLSKDFDKLFLVK